MKKKNQQTPYQKALIRMETEANRAVAQVQHLAMLHRELQKKITNRS